MNNPLTIKQLYYECARAIKNGNGDKFILISSDDEGNAYHALWYGLMDNDNEVEDMLEITPVDCYHAETSKTALLG